MKGISLLLSLILSLINLGNITIKPSTCIHNDSAPEEAAEANADKTLELTVSVSKNIFFNKHDVDFFVDDEFITTIKHGQSFNNTFILSPKKHKLEFSLSKDNRITSSMDFRLNRDKIATITIHTGKEEISIGNTDFSYKDALFSSSNFSGIFLNRSMNNFYDYISLDAEDQIYILYRCHISPGKAGNRITLKSSDTSYIVPSIGEGVYYDEFNDLRLMTKYDESHNPTSIVLIDGMKSVEFILASNQERQLSTFFDYVNRGSISLLPEENY